MRRFVLVFALLAASGVQAMPLGLRTAMWGVAGANRRAAADVAFPALDDAATAEDVAAAFEGVADGALVVNITDADEYSSFREWARMAGSASVKSCDVAWLSYALGVDAPIGHEITSNDVHVASFGVADGGAAWSFEVEIDGVNIGGGTIADERLKANLKKVLGLEGAARLDEAAFSSENVDFEIGTPKDGKATFTAKPRDAAKGDGGAFFMRVRVNQ